MIRPSDCFARRGPATAVAACATTCASCRVALRLGAAAMLPAARAGRAKRRLVVSLTILPSPIAHASGGGGRLALHRSPGDREQPVWHTERRGYGPIAGEPGGGRGSQTTS